MTFFFSVLEKQQERIQPAETAAALLSNRQVWTFPGVIFFSMGLFSGGGGAKHLGASIFFWTGGGEGEGTCRVHGEICDTNKLVLVIIHLPVFLYCMTMDIEEGKAASPKAQVVATNLMMAQS